MPDHITLSAYMRCTSLLFVNLRLLSPMPKFHAPVPSALLTVSLFLLQSHQLLPRVTPYSPRVTHHPSLFTRQLPWVNLCGSIVAFPLTYHYPLFAVVAVPKSMAEEKQTPSVSLVRNSYHHEIEN